MSFFKIPETIRMGLIAIAGTAIGWVTYEVLYMINPLQQFRATSTWIVEFALGVLRQHALHRHFTFRAATSYWKTLARAYVFYILCAIFGSGLNYALTDIAGWNYRLVWIICAIFVATMSLLFLKKSVFLIKKGRLSLKTRPLSEHEQRSGRL
jgi:hypothetical protein